MIPLTISRRQSKRAPPRIVSSCLGFRPLRLITHICLGMVGPPLPKAEIVETLGPSATSGMRTQSLSRERTWATRESDESIPCSSQRGGAERKRCLWRILFLTSKSPYKGGPNSGVFLQITADPGVDLEIPAPHVSVAIAEARGDFRVLCKCGRRLLRVHLAHNVSAGLEALSQAAKRALS